ncbi:MAG: hypothetical protein V9G29_08460 [Burkholderiaceae bacterium]
MDDSIVAQLAISGKLTRFRIFKSEAAILNTKPSSSGGTVQVTARSAFSNHLSTETRYRLTLVLEAVGIPKNGGDPAFRVSVEAHGYFEFPSKLSVEIIKHPTFIREMDRKVYFGAASHAELLARSLDLHGVKIPPEPGEFVDEDLVPSGSAVPAEAALSRTTPPKKTRTPRPKRESGS